MLQRRFDAAGSVVFTNPAFAGTPATARAIVEQTFPRDLFPDAWVNIDEAPGGCGFVRIDVCFPPRSPHAPDAREVLLRRTPPAA